MANILVTEENDIYRQLLSELLVPAGHTLHIADNYTNGLALLRQTTSLDLAIVDGRMTQGGDGADMIEAIWNTPRFRVLPVIGLSRQAHIFRLVQHHRHFRLVSKDDPYDREAFFMQTVNYLLGLSAFLKKRLAKTA